MFYTFLADILAVVHLAYVSFVVIGQLLILVGILLRWEWIRNFWFRTIHLAMIGVVALESIGNVMCPLTVWENDLRRWARTDANPAAAVSTEAQSFIGRLVESIMFFPDANFNHWSFKVVYVGFAVITLGTFIVAPPRRRQAPAEARSALDRRLLAVTILAIAGAMLLFSAYCMAEDLQARDQRALEEQDSQHSKDSAAGARKDPPPSADRTPVYGLTFTGLNFLGLALLGWSLGGRRKSGETAASSPSV